MESIHYARTLLSFVLLYSNCNFSHADRSTQLLHMKLDKLIQSFTREVGEVRAEIGEIKEYLHTLKSGMDRIELGVRDIRSRLDEEENMSNAESDKNYTNTNDTKNFDPAKFQDCNQLYIANAILTPDTQVSHGTTVDVDCTSSYTLVGNPSTTCDNGSFDYVPSCVASHNVFNISGMRYSNKRKVNIKLVDDPEDVWIIGGEFLSDGRLLLSDFRNDRLKLLNSQFEIEDSLYIEELWTVAVINETTAIATAPNKHRLQFVQIEPRLSILNYVENGDCFGIDTINQFIITVCMNVNETFYIQRLDMEGNVVGKHPAMDKNGNSLMFKDPNFLKISQTTGSTFISDLQTEVVTSLSADGDMIYKYSNDDLQTPDNIIIDDLDNIAVCTYRDVQIIDKSGKKVRDLLTESDVLYDPETIAYRRNDSTLIIAGYETNDMFVFQLTN